MKFGQIAESKRVNDAICCCFEYLCDHTQQRFVRKLREQPHDSDQIMHTFWELVLGAYLSSRGLEVRHENQVEGKTPDWCVLDRWGGVLAIIELVNSHIDAVTENEIAKQVRTGGMAIYWRDGHTNSVERLYNCILDKTRKYKAVVEKLGVPYIIAVHADFKAAVDLQELVHCLNHCDHALFKIHQHLTGALFFAESNERQFSFSYEQNPHAPHKFDLPGGVLSLVAQQGSKSE